MCKASGSDGVNANCRSSDYADVFVAMGGQFNDIIATQYPAQASELKADPRVVFRAANRSYSQPMGTRDGVASVQILCVNRDQWVVVSCIAGVLTVSAFHAQSATRYYAPALWGNKQSCCLAVSKVSKYMSICIARLV